jgi:hypothetical protein
MSQQLPKELGINRPCAHAERASPILDAGAPPGLNPKRAKPIGLLRWLLLGRAQSLSGGGDQA